MVHWSSCVCVTCLHSDTGWHAICHSLQYTIPSKCAQTLNPCFGLPQFWHVQYEATSNTCALCFHQRFQSNGSVNTLGLWPWTSVNTLVFKYPQWDICTFFLLYSRLYSFVITTVFALLFLKTVSVSFFQDTQHNSLVNTKLNNPWEFCLRLPLHPYQCTNIIGLSSMISSVTVRTSWCPKLHPTRCHRSDSWDPWWDLWCDIILAAGTFTARCLLTLLVNFTSTSGKKNGYLRHIYTTFILGTALQNCWLAGQ